MQARPYDVAIIGGGIVGTATAMALLDRLGTSLILIEAEKQLAAHQTGNNSGVIHSGLYYRPGSLKAHNCVRGREAMYRFCMEHGIAHDRCGKVVVAVQERELAVLAELEERGKANGLSGLRRLGPEELREYEPHVHGIGGLLVPETGIVDFAQVTNAFADQVRHAGGKIRLGARVLGCVSRQDELILRTTVGEIHCRSLVNCAGLYSDRIAKMCGVDPGLQIIPFRGEYYRLVSDRRGLVNNLIYPVPDPRFPFLGVHFTRRIDGMREAGPNAVLAWKREGYKASDISLRDAFEFFAYRGFWRMAARYWTMSVGEYYRSASKRAFVNALKKLVPEVSSRDVERAGAGVRAQALEPNGFLVDDFRIVEVERQVHILNAPSPAATASISIGQDIADIARKNFSLG